MKLVMISDFSNDSRYGCPLHPPHIPLLGNTMECNRSMSHDYPSSHSPKHPTHPFLAIPSFWLDAEEEHGKPTKVIMSTIHLLKSWSVLVCGLWFVDAMWYVMSMVCYIAVIVFKATINFCSRRELNIFYFLWRIFCCTTEHETVVCSFIT